MPFLTVLLTISFLFWLFRPTTPALRTLGVLGAAVSVVALVLSVSRAREPALVVTVLASIYALGFAAIAFGTSAKLRR